MEIISWKKFILIAGIFVFILTLFIMIVNSFQQQEETALPLLPSPFPTITPFEPDVTVTGFIPGNTQNYRESVRKANQQETNAITQDAALGRLLEFLPYSGTNFSMRYDYNQNKFFVTIPSAKRSDGEKEFNDFLKKNGVQNRDWISSSALIMTYE